MNKYLLFNNDKMNYYDEDENELKMIGPIKKLNLLVGINNSGKSRFIRNIICSNSKSIFYYEKEIFNSYALIRRINQLVQYHGQYFVNLNLQQKLDKTNKSDTLSQIALIYNNIDKVNKVHKDSINRSLNEYLEEFFEKEFVTGSNFYYIPILRGIENFEKYFNASEIESNIQLTKNDFDKLEEYRKQSNKIYLLKTSGEYKINEKRIFTGEDFHNQVMDILLGSEEKREKFHEFEDFINQNFYDGEGFRINANKDEMCLMVKIKNDKEYELYNLGDGIKQLIVILYQMFVHKDEKYTFYIEEPEINLHPGFQRKLMELLLSNTFKNHTFFINTHSNHIIDIINDYEDTTIFKFNKKEKMQISKITNDNISILNELGIRSSSIFLSNCTIWVEGISDRIYLKKYLELYFKKEKIENLYKENIHYSFVEYQGNNITHWNFDVDNNSDDLINTKWLSHNTFVVVDNDDASSSPNSKKNVRHNKLEKLLNNNFYKLKSREMENLISLSILEKMLKKDNGLVELKRKKYKSPQSKIYYTQEVISNQKTYLGEFIEETYDNLKYRYRTDSSKTVKNKAEFAKKICNEILDWDDLTEEAKDLTKRIFKFIEENNK